MDSLDYLDDLIREYLLFRGFHATLRSFEGEIKSDKMANFDAERLTLTLIAQAKALDFPALQDTWSYLEKHVFVALGSSTQSSQVRRMETSLFRYFIVCAIQQSKPSKVVEFFQSIDLASSPADWMTWTSITFLRRPQSTPPFEVYFTKMWLDLFVTSLRNFLEMAFACMPLPRLLNFNVERIKRKSLELEVSKLKETAEYWKNAQAVKSAVNISSSSLPTVHPDDEPFILLDEELFLDPSLTQGAFTEIPRTHVAVSRDGQWIAASFQDEPIVRYWNVAKPQTVQKLHGDSSVSGITWAEKSLVATFERSVKLTMAESKWTQDAPLDISSQCSNLLSTNLLLISGESSLRVLNLKTLAFESSGTFPNSEAERVLHVLRSAQSKYTIVCTISSVFILDSASLQLLHHGTIPFVPLACFSLADNAVSLISSRGQVITLSCSTGVADPLQGYSLPSFPHITTAQSCAVVPISSMPSNPHGQQPSPVPSTGAGSQQAPGGVPNSQSSVSADPGGLAHLLVAGHIYLLPSGRLVQHLPPSKLPLASVGRSSAANATPGSNPPLMLTATGLASQTAAPTASGTATSVMSVSATGHGRSPLLRSMSTLSAPSHARPVTAGASDTSSITTSTSMPAGGRMDHVTCVSWNGNMIAQGMKSGAVRTVKLMVV